MPITEERSSSSLPLSQRAIQKSISPRQGDRPASRTPQPPRPKMLLDDSQDKTRQVKTCPHCGEEIEHKRSLPQSNLYHAIIKTAYDNWPEDHHFPPEGVMHLRKWLQCQAGHCNVIIHRKGIDNLTFFTRLIAEGAAVHRYVWTTEDATQAIAVIPRSVAFCETEQREFAALMNRVVEIATLALGWEHGALVKAAKAAMGNSTRRRNYVRKG